MELTLERRDQENETPILGGGLAMMTPAIDEEDWNTNFPYTVDTEATFQHIKHNKGDDSISDDDVRAAIALVQQAAREDRDGAL